MKYANEPIMQPNPIIFNLKFRDTPPTNEPSLLVIFEDTSSYDGSWKDGKKHGFGVLSLYNEDKYKGDFNEDEIEGKGTYVWANGQKYEGEWLNNKFNGKWKIVFLSKKTDDCPKTIYYEGDFVDGKKHGIWKFANEIDLVSYEGSFDNDKMEGKGIYICPEGEYEGEFKDGIRTGNATFVSKNGDKYVGNYEDDKKMAKVKWPL